MPHRATRAKPIPVYSSDSDTDSDDVDHQVEAARYKQLSLADALACSATRVRANQEIQAIVNHCYGTRCSKAVQADIVNDIRCAIASCDRRQSTKVALADLMRAVDKVLPQQKRSHLTNEYKKAMMSLARGAKSFKGKGCSAALQDDEPTSSDTEEVVEVLNDLPLPDAIILTIMQQLDPYTLARASNVCRAWKRVVSESDMWRHWCHALYPKHIAASTRHTSSQQCRLDACTFNALVAGDPRPIMMYKAPPRIWHHQQGMVWTCLHTHQSTALSSAQGARVLFPTPYQVALWLCREWPPVTRTGQGCSSKKKYLLADTSHGQRPQCSSTSATTCNSRVVGENASAGQQAGAVRRIDGQSITSSCQSSSDDSDAESHNAGGPITPTAVSKALKHWNIGGVR